MDHFHFDSSQCVKKGRGGMAVLLTEPEAFSEDEDENVLLMFCIQRGGSLGANIINPLARAENINLNKGGKEPVLQSHMPLSGMSHPATSASAASHCRD